MNSKEKGDIGEDFVNGIAFNSFLEHWCYPNPKDENGDKNEICDLLIVFSDILIIISVKNHEFKDRYSRYFRKTIDKAVRQIYGAEKRLFTSDISIKHPNKKIERFPREKINSIYRVIVNLGEGVKFYPFNKETKDEKFIALFDKEAFETIVNELDTIPDFIEYLRKREQLFSNKTVTILPGEEDDFPDDTAIQFLEYAQMESNPLLKKDILISGTEHDLLGHYLRNNRTFPEYIESKEYNGMYLQFDGNWESFKSEKQVIEKKALDKNSYFLDELVKREVLNNVNEKSEELATAIMAFNRFDRRVIANTFFNFYELYKDNEGDFLGRRYFDFDQTGFVFCFYTQSMPQEMINRLLEIALDSFCIHTGYKNKNMILIATTKEFKQFKLGIVKNIEPFSKEIELQVLDDVKQLGWFTKHHEFRFTEKEYPDEK